jgi:uncharacterized protein involved in exopolysaccharide biosynthesis/Mrp family chromosome partitioning ATPase
MKHTQHRPTTTQGPGITLGDIYFVLFRHKWKIILSAAAGILAAVAALVVNRPLYQSEAKLFIRYILESKSPTPDFMDSRIKSTDTGANIINSEIEILTSLDLAQQVVDTIGAEKILAKAGGGKDRNQAATLVKEGLSVEVPYKSSVIRIVFQHPDPEVVQPVLNEVIDDYFKKHAEIHRAAGTSDDFLTQETDQLRSKLAQTEQELRKAKNKAGVISLDDSRKAYTEQIAKIRQEIFDAEAQLAERQAALNGIAKLLPGATEAPIAALPEILADQFDNYKNLCARLDLLRKREQELLVQFTEQSTLVKEVREQIAEAQVLKHKIEKEHPELTRLAISQTKSSDQRAGLSFDLPTEAARTMALESRIKVLNSQLDQIRSEASSVDEMEVSILELQRKKQLEEANYRYFSASLEQSRIDEALGAGRVSNISRIQSPSPPFRAPPKSPKMLAMLALGGILVGLAWAFLIELYLDHSVKRPIEVQTKLGLPLFLSIPDMSRNGHRRRLAAAAEKEPSHLKNSEGAASTSVANGSDKTAVGLEIAPWDTHHPMRTFFEALRDRLIVSFEVRNLTHKPKLVAVTSAGRGSGVSTIAAGLAACLSETGDGNVLLVDMNLEHGAAQQFYQGRAACGLDEALDTKDSALIQDNLYMATEGSNGDKLPRLLPKRFTRLVPKLKASDYDYIILDMPPISQTSITPRLASFMDMVLLVIESEKTDREIIQQASELLAESKANVSAVLNKTRTYVPARLHQEYLSDV